MKTKLPKLFILVTYIKERNGENCFRRHVRSTINPFKDVNIYVQANFGVIDVFREEGIAFTHKHNVGSMVAYNGHAFTKAGCSLLYCFMAVLLLDRLRSLGIFACPAFVEPMLAAVVFNIFYQKNILFR